MPVRLRSNNGKFIPYDQDITKGEIKYTTDSFPSSIVNTNKLIKFIMSIICIILITPWVFIITPSRASIGGMSEKLYTFYDDNFSCKSYCLSNSQNSFNQSRDEKQKDGWTL
jgi:hypothetical protein